MLQEMKKLFLGLFVEVPGKLLGADFVDECIRIALLDCLDDLLDAGLVDYGIDNVAFAVAI